MEHISSGRLYHNGQYLTLIGQPTLVDGLDGKAIYLNGRGQYVDLGENITCQGDLEYCRNGFTLRMTLKPEQLRENTYFLGSYPISLYYKDGRLQATARTSTKSWTVNTPAFSAGKWQLVELSWHPTNGLTLYLNGQRASHVLYPTTHAEIQSTSSKTYVGRSLSDSPDRYYSDAVIDDVEFWNAHRNYLVSYNMIGTDGEDS